MPSSLVRVTVSTACALLLGACSKPKPAHHAAVAVTTLQVGVAFSSCAATANSVYLLDGTQISAVSTSDRALTRVPTRGGQIDRIAATDAGVAWVSNGTVWWWPKGWTTLVQLATDTAPETLAADRNQVCWAHDDKREDPPVYTVTCASGPALATRETVTITASDLQMNSDYRAVYAVERLPEVGRMRVVGLPSKSEWLDLDVIYEVAATAEDFVVKTRGGSLLRAGMQEHWIGMSTDLMHLTGAGKYIYAQGEGKLFELAPTQHLMREVDSDRDLHTTTTCSDGRLLYAGTTSNELVELDRTGG